MTLSPNDLYILSRAFVGQSISGLRPQNPMVGALLTELDWAKTDDLNTARRLLKDHMTSILGVDPMGSPPALPPIRTTDTYVPPLPESARLSDEALLASDKVGDWYKRTVLWVSKKSPMTPFQFTEASVVWLIGLAVNRRVAVTVHDQITPNLYLLIVAETSKYAKSTGMNAIRSLIYSVMPHMLIPGSTTPEGMMEMLSGELPSNFQNLRKRDQEVIEQGRKFAGQRGIVQDEYSSVFALMKRDYMAGFVELLMRLYDGQRQEEHHTRSGGLIIVKYPALSIFGATTPAALGRNITADMWENGAMARYLMMFRDEPLPFTTDYISSTPPQDILAPLLKLHTRLPEIRANDPGKLELFQDGESDEGEFQPQSALIDPAALQAYLAYSRAVKNDMLTDDLDERLHGNYSRLHINALKMALGLACMDWSDRNEPVVRITLGHWALAQQIAEKCRYSLHRLLPVVSQTSDIRTRRSLLSLLNQYRPEGLTIDELGNKLGRNNNDIRSAIDVLMESGLVESSEHKPNVGRPTRLYRALSGNFQEQQTGNS
jgi:predicted transcriptional regulator